MAKAKKAPENTAVAYLRVSTSEQADSGAGLDAQRAAIVAAAAARGWTIIDWFEDAGASGKSLDGRPQLAEALAAVRAGEAAALVVAKLDRLSRSALDFAGLVDDAKRRGWNLVALDLGIDLSTPAGKLIAGVMAQVAEWERDVIGQRTRDGLAAKRAAGVRLGRPRDLAEQTGRRIIEARAAGDTLAAIADQLNADGTPTARGGARWYPSTVLAVLNSQDAPTWRAAA